MKMMEKLKKILHLGFGEKQSYVYQELSKIDTDFVFLHNRQKCFKKTVTGTLSIFKSLEIFVIVCENIRFYSQCSGEHEKEYKFVIYGISFV